MFSISNTSHFSVFMFPQQRINEMPLYINSQVNISLGYIKCLFEGEVVAMKAVDLGEEVHSNFRHVTELGQRYCIKNYMRVSHWLH